MIENLYTLIQLAALQEVGFEFRNRYTLFRLPFARVEDILQIFPKFTMDPQIDLNRDSLAVLIGNKLNSCHISIMPHRGIEVRKRGTISDVAI